MVIEQLKNKEVRPCKDYQLRVLFLDPKLIYDRINVDHFARVQSVPIGDMFRINGNFCGCGCGAEVTGRRRRWATDNCKYFAQAVWCIINGHSETISSYLKLYHGVVACIECGITDVYTEYANGLSVSSVHKDHIVPVFKSGGGCWLSNYQYLCDTCHKQKTKTDLKK
jgi:5-methylcytosine-specific restriction endonuclease McrA